MWFSTKLLIPALIPEACICGRLNRKLFSRCIDQEPLWFEEYLRLVADPRAVYCSHRNLISDDASTSTISVHGGVV